MVEFGSSANQLESIIKKPFVLARSSFPSLESPYRPQNSNQPTEQNIYGVTLKPSKPKGERMARRSTITNAQYNVVQTSDGPMSCLNIRALDRKNRVHLVQVVGPDLSLAKTHGTNGSWNLTPLFNGLTFEGTYYNDDHSRYVVFKDSEKYIGMGYRGCSVVLQKPQEIQSEKPVTVFRNPATTAV